MTTPDWIAAEGFDDMLRVWAMSGSTVLATAHGPRSTPLADLTAKWGKGLPTIISDQAREHRAVPCAPLGSGLRDMPGLSQAAPTRDVLSDGIARIAGVLQAHPDFDGVICLTGARSAWVSISAGEVTDFRTFLTGEMAGLFRHHSSLAPILGNADVDGGVFDAALAQALSRPEALMARLSAIAADPEHARSRLIGSLIGAELAAAKPWWLGRAVLVVGDGWLADLYARALRHVGLAPPVVPGADAALAGLIAAWRKMGGDTGMIHDDRALELGEGALWHPERQELFWFDILGHRLHGASRDWDFDEPASAAGWVDRDRLLIATASGLWVLHLAEDRREKLCDLEADRPDTRSNDGKADPWGGFWIGTMGRKAEHGAGAIYRWYRGELRLLRPRVTIPNSTCFDAAQGCVYFSDTAESRVYRQGLDPDTGWPVGEVDVFLDLAAVGLNPDGATVDAQGRVWIAEWGAGRVACHAPDGRFLGAETFPASQTSCAVFGGVAFDTLFVTSAVEGMDEAGRRTEPHGGKTFARKAVIDGKPVVGLAEPRVIL